MKPQKTSRLGLAVLTIALACALTTSTSVLAKESAVELQSIGALEFGPGQTLFVADSLGAAVHALQVSPPQAGQDDFSPVADLDEKLAAMLGVTPREIKIEDMTTHESTGTIYLSVTRGKGDKSQPVLAQVARSGDISILDVKALQHDTLPLDNAPEEGAKMYRTDARTLTVTDLEFIDGELYIAGLSNEEFASTLRRVAYPFTDTPTATSLEIYHGAHGEWETFAPIFSFIPYEIEGTKQILAGYLCTPLVTFPIEEVKKKNKLRGKTIAELGWGNIPTDMVAYENSRGSAVLVVNNSRGNMRIKASEIIAAQKREGITSRVGAGVGVKDDRVPLGTVVQAADFDEKSIAILNRSIDNGALSLRTVPKSRL